MAQLGEHELRDDDFSFQDAGFADIENAAVDDDAGIQNFGAERRLLLRAARFFPAQVQFFPGFDRHAHAQISADHIEDDIDRHDDPGDLQFV